MSQFKANCHPPRPKDNVDSPQAAIKKLIHEQIEHIYVFKRAKQIMRFEGDRDKIIIDSRYLIRMRDSIVVHNHPRGASFSIEDIQNFITYNVKECILVTENHIHHLYRPGDDWNINVESDYFLTQLEACRSIAENELEKLISQHEITRHEKEVEIIHYIWLYFFRELNGIKYVRKKAPQA